MKSKTGDEDTNRVERLRETRTKSGKFGRGPSIADFYEAIERHRRASIARKDKEQKEPPL